MGEKRGSHYWCWRRGTLQTFQINNFLDSLHWACIVIVLDIQLLSSIANGKSAFDEFIDFSDHGPLVLDGVWFMLSIMVGHWKGWIVYELVIYEKQKNENTDTIHTLFHLLQHWNRSYLMYMSPFLLLLLHHTGSNALAILHAANASGYCRWDAEPCNSIRDQDDKVEIRMDWKGRVVHELKMVVMVNGAVWGDGDGWRMAWCKGGQWVGKKTFWWVVSGEMEPVRMWHVGDGSKNWRENVPCPTTGVIG